MHADQRNEWLFKLGQHLSLAELAFDEAGLCQISLNNELAVTIYKLPETDELVLFGQLPVDYLSSGLMQQMLMENRNHSKQNAPVLSLSENMDAIEVHIKLLQPELDAAENVLRLLIGHLEYWRNSLAQAAY